MSDRTFYFRTHSIGMSKLREGGPVSLLTAARHNLREIQAELGADGHIDATLMYLNETWVGPGTAVKVVELSDQIMNEAGLNAAAMRKNRCQAIEIVFSLPTRTMLDTASYFAECLKWSQMVFALPVLSAVLHRDEGAPHLHVLLLPVLGGKQIGSKPINRTGLHRLRESFFRNVAAPAGLCRSQAKVKGSVKKLAVNAVLQTCERRNYPNLLSEMWPFVKEAIQRDPTEAMLALKIDLNRFRQSEQTSNDAIEIASDPKGFQADIPTSNPYPCVGFGSGAHLQASKSQAPDTLNCVNHAVASADCSPVTLHQKCMPAPEELHEQTLWTFSSDSVDVITLARHH